MEINQRIQFLEERIAKGLSFLDNALEKEKFSLAVLNIHDRFINLLELGLIHWRMGNSPINQLQEAVDFILSGRQVLIERGLQSAQLEDLPLYYSVYVASLLNKAHPSLDVNDYRPAMAPGVFLGNVLMGVDSIVDWDKHKDKMPNKAANKLARATFELYAGLLSGVVTAEEGAERGGNYFSRRRNDPYFKSLPLLAGGTHNNDRFVDFRLAAVLKKIGSTVPTVHAWQW